MLGYITHLLIHFWTYRLASGDSIPGCNKGTEHCAPTLHFIHNLLPAYDAPAQQRAWQRIGKHKGVGKLATGIQQAQLFFMKLAQSGQGSPQQKRVEDLRV